MSNVLDPNNPPQGTVNVRNAKAADPGVSCVLLMADGSKFNAPVSIFLRVLYVPEIVTESRSTYISSLVVEDRVEEKELTVILPFGDRRWKEQLQNAINDDLAGGLFFRLDVTVHREEEPIVGRFDLNASDNTIELSRGHFHVTTRSN